MSANRPFWGLLTRRSVHADTASELYGRVVAQARAAPYYSAHGVPDTPEGRLEMILLNLVLLLRRLQRGGEATAELTRALSETYVTDMDDCMREMGVSDISVARKVKKAAAALHDRGRDYGAALTAGDRAGLARLIARHAMEIVDGAATPGSERISSHAFEVEAAMSAASLDAVIGGTANLPSI